jgi:hypothetical protein
LFRPSLTLDFPPDHQNPCQFEMDQFLRCTQSAVDLSTCAAFRDQLQQCKVNYGEERADFSIYNPHPQLQFPGMQ